MEMSENIRRLRRDGSMTQEELADRLGITAQSVSKWERGESYPDITLLPALAGCLGVSIDELMDVGAEARKRRLSEMAETWPKLAGRFAPGARAAAVDWLRTQLRDLPNEWDWQLRLAFFLSGQVELGAPLTTEADHREAVAIYRRILRFAQAEQLRVEALYYLVLTLRNLGEMEEAKLLAATLPLSNHSREHAIPFLLAGEEKAAYIQFQLTGLVAWFGSLVDQLAEDTALGYTDDEKSRLLEKAVRLRALMTDEGDQPFLPGQDAVAQLRIARLAARSGQPDRALAALAAAADAARRFDLLPRGHRFTGSVLLNRVSRGNTFPLDALSGSMTTTLLSALESRSPEEPLSVLAGDPRLQALVAGLRQTEAAGAVTTPTTAARGG